MKEKLDFGYESHAGLVDPYYHTELINDWQFSYSQISSGEFKGELNKIWFGGIEIYEEKLSTAIFQEGCCEQGILCLGIFRNFKNPALWLGNTVESVDIININPNKEVMISTPENSIFYALQMPMNLLIDDENNNLDNAIGLIKNDRLNQKIYTKIHSVFNMLGEVAVDKELRKQIVSEFIDIGDEYLFVAQKNKVGYGYSKIKAKKALKEILSYLRSYQDLLITVDDCCKITNTSRRTLQNYFEMIVGCSPSLFLKYWKLNCARKMLLNTKEDITVSQVASYWGFWHFSQFANDYRILFGELPSETLVFSRNRIM